MTFSELMIVTLTLPTILRRLIVFEKFSFLLLAIASAKMKIKQTSGHFKNKGSSPAEYSSRLLYKNTYLSVKSHHLGISVLLNTLALVALAFIFKICLLS